MTIKSLDSIKLRQLFQIIFHHFLQMFTILLVVLFNL
ncbi:unnamed protein product [Schistosoma margrebowiei]|uniref:Uncharacterized protein n=1 Tax=Schistosoma margrebowiei TaxID=48269 RepID=A0A183MDA7_9TREM|nr:unnamed protein product [Schistosoma margrebowiei]